MLLEISDKNKVELPIFEVQDIHFSKHLRYPKFTMQCYSLTLSGDHLTTLIHRRRRSSVSGRRPWVHGGGMFPPIIRASLARLPTLIRVITPPIHPHSNPIPSDPHKKEERRAATQVDMLCQRV